MTQKNLEKTLRSTETTVYLIDHTDMTENVRIRTQGPPHKGQLTSKLNSKMVPVLPSHDPSRRVKIAKKWPFDGKKKDSTEMYTNDTSGYVE